MCTLHIKTSKVPTGCPVREAVQLKRTGSKREANVPCKAACFAESFTESFSSKSMWLDVCRKQISSHENAVLCSALSVVCVVVVEFLTNGASPPQPMQDHEPCATFRRCRCACAVRQGHVQCSEKLCVCACVILNYSHALAYNHRFWTSFRPCGNVEAHHIESVQSPVVQP